MPYATVPLLKAFDYRFLLLDLRQNWKAFQLISNPIHIAFILGAYQRNLVG